jgi:hypothetical protein
LAGKSIDEYVQRMLLRKIEQTGCTREDQSVGKEVLVEIKK